MGEFYFGKAIGSAVGHGSAEVFSFTAGHLSVQRQSDRVEEGGLPGAGIAGDGEDARMGERGLGEVYAAV